MNMFTNVRRVALVAAAGMTLMACGSTTGRPLLEEGIGLNPYAGVPDPHYFYGDLLPPVQRFADQDQYVDPHCARVARETNPSPGKMGLHFGVNHGVAGGVGGGLGFAADSAIVGAATSGTTILGAGVYNGVANAFSGYESGKETGDMNDVKEKRACKINNAVVKEKRACKINNAVGIREVAPSELDELKRTGSSPGLENAIKADPAPQYMPTPR
jgi:hypothetical protein